MRPLRRRALGLAAALAAGLAAPAAGQDLLEAGLAASSRRTRHGYDRGDGFGLDARVGLGLAGFAVTSVGRHGLFLDVEAGARLDDTGRDERDAVAELRYELKAGLDGRLAAGYRQWLFGDGSPRHSEELFARYRHTLRHEHAGLAIHPFVELAYDVDRWDGAYAAVGFQHAFSLERRLGARASLDVDARVAWSDRRGADGRDRAFGFHHGRLRLALPFEIPAGGAGTVAIGPMAGWDRAARSIRRTRAFEWGVEARLLR